MIVFVAGPYRAPTQEGIDANIQAARDVAIALWRAGFGVFCPHLNSANMDSIVPDEQFLNADLEILHKACDALVCVPGWESSEGAQGEVNFARGHGIPVFGGVPTEAMVREAWAGA